jgi:acyl-lipid omega-6 desaturase (Delta-12 desaturase)
MRPADLSESQAAMTSIPDCTARYEAFGACDQPRLKRGLLDVGTSVGPYLALSATMYLMLRVSPLVMVALVIPTTGFLVRVFVIFHDCVHNSLLPSRRANTWVGTALGLLVFAPFRQWRYEHARHHATSGDLDRRGVGDVQTLTVAEYQSRSGWGRFSYRLFRHPAVMFGLGPLFAMIIGPRLVYASTRSRMRSSVLGTDAALVVMVGGLCWLIGWEDLLLVWSPAAMLAGSVGIWLFYVQHQFEDTYWQRQSEWSCIEAALGGSSYLKLPKLLQFFTGNIGFHHVHHLNPRIPNYRLQRAHDANAIFAGAPSLSIRDGLRAVKFKLWDEETGQLVTFAQAKLHSQGAEGTAQGSGRVQPWATAATHTADPGRLQQPFHPVPPDPLA